MTHAIRSVPATSSRCSQRQRSTATRLFNGKQAASSKAAAMQPVASEQSIEELKAVRLAKVEAMREQGVNPYEYTWPVTYTSATTNVEWEHLAAGEEDKEASVSVAGRIMARRVFGKLAFFSLQDAAGTIQLYIEQAVLGEEPFAQLKAWVDTGDIIGVKGSVKRTDKGEMSVVVREWAVLTKSLLPLPDKYHGLKDMEKRYRQRHIDLIVNPEVRETFRRRAMITSGLRRDLDDDGFLEIETPVLQVQSRLIHVAISMPIDTNCL
jgi:lysyl-tRNA synthetase, class II